MPREAQMRLFPAGYRAKRGGVAVEFRLHCAVADLLRRLIQPGWRYTHLPFGEYRPPATAAKLKRMGVTPGWPDLLLIGPEGQCCWVELKRRGETLKPEQTALKWFLIEGGHGHLVA